MSGVGIRFPTGSSNVEISSCSGVVVVVLLRCSCSVVVENFRTYPSTRCTVHVRDADWGLRPYLYDFYRKWWAWLTGLQPKLGSGRH